MAVVEESEQEFRPEKKKPASEDDKRRGPFFSIYLFSFTFLNSLLVYLNCY